MTAFSVELTRNILESAPDAMLLVDRAGRIVFANQQVTALFGYAVDDLLGQPIETLIPERFHDRHAGHRERYGAGMRVRPMGSGLELCARRRDASEFPVEISLSPVRGGEQPLIAATIRDVTDRRRTEAEAVAARRAADEANAAKSRFLAAASHDLRQPLQALAMLNGTLRRATRDGAVAEIAGHQEQAITAMSRLLNSLLDISKLESGAIRPEITDFRVAELFEELRLEFAGLAAAKGLALDFDECSDRVHSDPSLVGQILKNLVANAIKYTREGMVRLSCRHAGGCVRIEVLDTGIGIPADQLGHIFEEFYQVGVSPNTTRDGYGLGLSIVDRAARLLGTRIDVESEPGRGSRFALELPAGAGEAGAAATAGHAASPARAATPAPLLLVEDDAGVRDATRMLLRAEGWPVAIAATAAEAERLVRENGPPALVLADYHLGDGTGMQVIANLRALCGAALPAIVITGDTSSAAREMGRDGGVRVLSKPVQPEVLLALVRELMAPGAS